MTTTPFMETESSIARIPSTAAWSAAFLSPRPIHRPAPIAAISVTRTSSSARFRSGRVGAPGPRGSSMTVAMGSILELQRVHDQVRGLLCREPVGVQDEVVARRQLAVDVVEVFEIGRAGGVRLLDELRRLAPLELSVALEAPGTRLRRCGDEHPQHVVSAHERDGGAVRDDHGGAGGGALPRLPAGMVAPLRP